MEGRRALVALLAGSVIAVGAAGCGTGEPDGAASAPEPVSVGGIESETTAEEPGDLVSVRPLAPEWVPDNAIGWELTYLSQGVHGDPVEVRGVVFAPDSPTEEPRPVIAWAHGDNETGVADACSPTSRGAVKVPHAEDLLEQGYVIAATDYEGLGGEGLFPFGVNLSSGRSVIDAARAAQQIPGADASERVLMLGHSQGGAAALMAAKLVPEYAPELDLMGAVAGAAAIEMRSTMTVAANQPEYFGFFAMTVAGYDFAYDDLDPSDLLTDEGVARLSAVEEGCVDDVAAALNDVVIDDVLKTQPLEHPRWTARFTENEVGESLIEAPVLVLHGEDDPIVFPLVSEQVAARLCTVEGNVVVHKELPGVDHLGLAQAAKADVLGFTADRLAGKPAPSTCRS